MEIEVLATVAIPLVIVIGMIAVLRVAIRKATQVQ